MTNKSNQYKALAGCKGTYGQNGFIPSPVVTVKKNNQLINGLIISAVIMTIAFLAVVIYFFVI